MSNDKSVVVKINGDSKGLTDELNNVKTQAEQLEEGLKKIAVVSGIAFAGLTAAIVKVVGSFREAEQATFRTEAVIKSTGAAAGFTTTQIVDLASSLESTTTFADEVIQSGENLLLTFTNIGKDVFPQATKAMLDMSTALGQDVSTSAIQLGKALNDPVLGVTALGRAGVQFTEQQKAMIKSFVDTNQIAKAQAIILKELETQMGGAAEAAAQGTGKFKQLNNTLDNLFEAIGEQLTQKLIPFSDKLKEIIETATKSSAFITAASNVLLYGAAIAGLVTLFATIGIAIVGITSGLGLVSLGLGALAVGGVAAVAAIVGGVAVLIEKLGGIEVVLQKSAAAFTFIGNQAELGFNIVIIAINKVLAKTFELISATAALVPGMKGVEEANQRMTDYLLENNKKLIEDNQKLGISYDDILNQKKLDDAAKKQAEEDAKAFDAREKAMQEELDQRALQNQKKKQQDAAFKAELKTEADADAKIAALQKQLGEAERDKASQVEQTKLKQQIAALQKIRDTGASEEKKQKFKDMDELRAAEEKDEADRLKFKKQFGQDTLDSAASLGAKLFGQSSGLAKSLFVLSKASALADIAINTSRAATLALAFPPGPPFSFAYVAGAVAAGAIQAANVVSTIFTGASDGALVGDGSGSLALGDRHPFMLERGELVVPRRNFDEVIEATARSRGMVTGQETSMSSSSNSVTVHIDMSDNAAQFITARQYENLRLGIDRG